MSEHKSTFVVTPEMSAEQHGNPGFPVLATPALLGLFEKAAIAAMADRLAAGEGSVGTGASLQHLAATPLGERVTIIARITGVEGKRVSFALDAHDEHEKIGTCSHDRFIVDIARFGDRLAKKTANKASDSPAQS
ncbi:thioesterase family protein [Chelatococcus asaccharovorans]|uniref:Thioesterase superfamily protein n=1 Tax=Chelatococcus asaccharovorans TaxID=28210 RepID=A0A2V3USB9_9HYPH|nr:thioesterase family protein [Chelatococcus asaccharovorans]MBS7707419.1 thioesterase family protein [Chelatococcus asaccharovorans]PXW63599.1 thioesterase superfamily protein [Chelatococcus asaccharovorans]